ncbi:MAG: AAA family ATPase [Desulfovibrionaceae bacterium]|nr:AAA family ATPase [Desulfovibrionaceae bacterium]
MLTRLETRNVGWASRLSVRFAERLNVITGFAGAGKSLLMNLMWWSQTHVWPSEVNSDTLCGGKVFPADLEREASLEYGLLRKKKESSGYAYFAPHWHDWTSPGESLGSTLVVYALADGSFALWDPSRNTPAFGMRAPAFVFTPRQIYDGFSRNGAVLINGLIRDLASLIREGGEALDDFVSVLSAFTPSYDERFILGPLIRLSFDDVRDMPTLRMGKRNVAVTHISFAHRRCLILAYFLFWIREEHKRAAQIQGADAADSLLFLIDDIDHNLHPAWSRVILISLINTISFLWPDTDVQLAVSTNSPLVLSSIETFFDPNCDAWLSFSQEKKDAESRKMASVRLDRRSFFPMGSADAWLKSAAFNLESAYSLEAEAVIALAREALANEDYDLAKAQELDDRLREVLPNFDPFWLRWRYVAEKRGWVSPL